MHATKPPLADANPKEGRARCHHAETRRHQTEACVVRQPEQPASALWRGRGRFAGHIAGWSRIILRKCDPARLRRWRVLLTWQHDIAIEAKDLLGRIGG